MDVAPAWTYLDPFTVLVVLQSRFGNKFLIFSLVCPLNGTAVLKGWVRSFFSARFFQNGKVATRPPGIVLGFF